MSDPRKFEIFLSAPPGLELALKKEALQYGFTKPKAVPGGVRFRGAWPEVWRANLKLRGAGRVLARIGSFQAMHLDQLEKNVAELDWGSVLQRHAVVQVDVTCKSSRIYHQRAAAERIENALREVQGVTIGAEDALRVMVRIEHNQCTFSIDTSGELLHKRGHKEVVGKAPLRETLAALFLRQCGYTGDEPVLDPMCGSGTFVIEAAEIAMGLDPGRSRSFAFEHLASFDAARWQAMREDSVQSSTQHRFYGSDRDAGAIRGVMANATRAGVAEFCQFATQSISDVRRPDGPPGLIIVNPPYGTRIGDKRQLFGLYGSLGRTLKERFSRWRVAVVTSDAGLAKATTLPFVKPGPKVAHGGLKVTLWQTNALE